MSSSVPVRAGGPWTTAILIVGVVLLLFSQAVRVRAGQPQQASTWTTVEERLGTWDFLTLRPSLEPVLDEDGEPLALHARDCGSCHDEIFQQWQRSTHASALQDLQFLAEVAKPGSPRWLCLNCHIPLQDQRRYLVQADTRLEDRPDDVRALEEVPNPSFDPDLQSESITCATCHLRQDEQGRSQVLSARPVTDAPHPMTTGPNDLRTVCLGCHSPGQARITSTFFCWFDTAEELRQGPYAGSADCVDCHMPKDEEGRRQHHWVGGGVPKSFDDYDHLLERGWKPGLEITDIQVKDENGQRGALINFSNEHAGHWLPTADPERFLLLIARLQDGDGVLLAEDRLRIGQHWDWGDASAHRPAQRIADNRLKPGESRLWEPHLDPVAWEETKNLEVWALHVRLTQVNADHMKSTPLDSVTPYLPDLAEKMKSFESHYPFFTWIHREEIDIDTGLRKKWTLDQLVAASKEARTLHRDQRLDLLRQPDEPH